MSCSKRKTNHMCVRKRECVCACVRVCMCVSAPVLVPVVVTHIHILLTYTDYKTYKMLTKICLANKKKRTWAVERNNVCNVSYV